ncbi:methyltransferase domain-containing protein [Streptomyces sp. A1-5]|uniref:methyltransferase domain-containing protein n=1 Tax=Streptomyces sp. A1-5 TaxID=2738410 RepID=UPI001F2C5D80|nr:methyltransferase domain-containing protein [Streptomyces sp. A1-5]
MNAPDQPQPPAGSPDFPASSAPDTPPPPYSYASPSPSPSPSPHPSASPSPSPRPSRLPSPAYVHGYSDREARRLGDQADTLAQLLHAGTAYPAGSTVLEVGCGVGAQTLHLVNGSPGARIAALDRSAASLDQARAQLAAHAPHAAANVTWHRADLHRLPFSDASFDHVFLCFVLEHLPDPVRALTGLRRVLRPGGTLTAIEGDHGSVVFHPDSPAARRVIDHQVRLQAAAGGNALVGRQLHPLLTGAGFADVAVRPRTVYADASRPGLVSGFTRRTFIAMVESVRDEALAAGLTAPADWGRGIADLRRSAEPGGSFHYTFFKAVAVRPADDPADGGGRGRSGQHARSAGSFSRVGSSCGMHTNSLTPGASSAASFT